MGVPPMGFVFWAAAHCGLMELENFDLSKSLHFMSFLL